MPNTTDLAQELETLTDRHGLLYVLQALELTCLAKAERTRANRKDDLTAKGWDRAAKACSKACHDWWKYLSRKH